MHSHILIYTHADVCSWTSIHAYTHLYICCHICIHTYTGPRSCTHTHPLTHAYTHLHELTQTRWHTCLFSHVCVQMTCVDAHTQIYMYAPTRHRVKVRPPPILASVFPWRRHPCTQEQRQLSSRACQGWVGTSWAACAQSLGCLNVRRHPELDWITGLVLDPDLPALYPTWWGPAQPPPTLQVDTQAANAELCGWPADVSSKLGAWPVAGLCPPGRQRGAVVGAAAGGKGQEQSPQCRRRRRAGLCSDWTVRISLSERK